MSRPIRHRTPKHRVANSPAENLATPTRRRRPSSGRKWGERPRRMTAAERAEEARINAALRRHEEDRQRLEGPFGFGRMHPDIEYSLVVAWLSADEVAMRCFGVRWRMGRDMAGKMW